MHYSILKNIFTPKKLKYSLKFVFFTKKEIILQSKKLWETVPSLDDGNYILYQHLAWSQYLQGNQAAAMEYTNKTEEGNPKNLYTIYIKARINILDFIRKHHEFITKLFRRTSALLSIDDLLQLLITSRTYESKHLRRLSHQQN